MPPKFFSTAHLMLRIRSVTAQSFAEGADCPARIRHTAATAPGSNRFRNTCPLPAHHTTADQTGGLRKSDQRRDDLCGGALRLECFAWQCMAVFLRFGSLSCKWLQFRNRHLSA